MIWDGQRWRTCDALWGWFLRGEECGIEKCDMGACCKSITGVQSGMYEERSVQMVAGMRGVDEDASVVLSVQVVTRKQQGVCG